MPRRKLLTPPRCGSSLLRTSRCRTTRLRRLPRRTRLWLAQLCRQRKFVSRRLGESLAGCCMGSYGGGCRLPAGLRGVTCSELRRTVPGGWVSTCVLQTKTFLKGVEVVAKLGRVARRRHSAAVAHFSSTILAATKVGASVDEDSSRD